MLAFSLFSIGAAIKAICVAIGGIVWLLVRRAKKQDDPKNQYDKAKDDNARVVTGGYADELNARVNRDLGGLQDSRSSNPVRPND